jgi:hypothetical protein
MAGVLRGRNVRLKKKQSGSDPELLDRIDMLNKNLANFRSDVAAIVRDTLLQIMKERDKPKKYVEVGYRG